MGAAVLLYSAAVYVLFLLSFVYFVAFVGGDMTGFLGAPKTIDRGASPLDGAPPALVNMALLAAFGLQHSIMARQSFKTVLTRIIPPAAERATYVLATVIMLVVLYVFWVPMTGDVWRIAAAPWAQIMLALYIVGIGLILLSTFLINHFELTGLLQSWRSFKKTSPDAPSFRTPSLYKYVRHPLYLGFIIAFWATSHMSVGHLLFAAVWTIYIFVAVGYEERDLIAIFGDEYRDYMQKTPSIFPFGRRK